MVLKTKSCNLLTTPSRSSPREPISGVVVWHSGNLVGNVDNRVTPGSHELGVLEER